MNEHLTHQKLAAGDLQALMEQVARKVRADDPAADVDRLWRAYRLAEQAHAGQVRRSGEPFLVHGLTTAGILADLHLDVDTITAALLHDVVEDTSVNLERIRHEFGDGVAEMVDGVTKVGSIRTDSAEKRRAENYRKLILAITKSLPTLMIKLADRLHNMRTIQYLERDRQVEMAQETIDVYAPLAHRFGVARIRWELEDRAFKVLHPERYFDIERGINQTRAERERLIEEIRGPIEEALRKADIEAKLSGRPKHFYSIYRKMQAQELPLDRIYDLLALRIIVQTKADCYHALGIIHSLFTPLMDRIKDYIANPKPNMYQSLHTTVRGPGGKFLEIQIRTQDMHELSEIGIAAHWRYKEGAGAPAEAVAPAALLKQIVMLQEDVIDAREFMDGVKIEFLQDEVYVFSPRGDVFQLPRGATPLDFAFAVHSEVGLHCVGAKVNGRIVSLRSTLQNGDHVEVLTNKSARPSTSWLEVVKTSRAKHHLRRWIRATQYLESLRLGREILEREASRRKLRLHVDRDLPDIAQQMGYSELEKMLAAVGSGELPFPRVLHRLQPPPPAGPAQRVVGLSKDLYAAVMRRRTTGVRIQGLDNVMVRYAQCCQPIPGDEVIGIVTRGRGVSVHRVSCPNLGSTEEERKIEVTWDAAPDQTFLVKLIVTASDRKGLLAEISQVIGAAGTNIHSGDFAAEGDGATATFLLEVRNLNNLERIQKAVQRVPSVQKVERYQVR